MDSLPGLGDRNLLSGPAPAATLPPPRLTVIGDSRSGGLRTLRLRLLPQRPVRLVTLHVAADAVVTAAAAGGMRLPADRVAGGGPWGFGFVFHAPPAQGIEVDLALRAGAAVRFRAMDASDGLGSLPGFRPRPPGVGIRGDHFSEMVAVARTSTF